SGPRLTTSRDWLRAGGRVLPLVGTTYMASDVHRNFLFAPNPALWERDFAELQRHGVNIVRTGLWFGWAKALQPGGAPREPILRALEAHVHAAARHALLAA